MKNILNIFGSLSIIVLVGLSLTVVSNNRHSQVVHASPQQTNCTFSGTLTAAGTTSPFNNTLNQCSLWRETYYLDTFSSISVQFEGAQDSGGSPGTFAAITGACVTSGNNPSTANSSTLVL